MAPPPLFSLGPVLLYVSSTEDRDAAGRFLQAACAYQVAVTADDHIALEGSSGAVEVVLLIAPTGTAGGGRLPSTLCLCSQDSEAARARMLQAGAVLRGSAESANGGSGGGGDSTSTSSMYDCPGGISVAVHAPGAWRTGAPLSMLLLTGTSAAVTSAQQQQQQQQPRTPARRVSATFSVAGDAAGGEGGARRDSDAAPGGNGGGKGTLNRSKNGRTPKSPAAAAAAAAARQFPTLLITEKSGREVVKGAANTPGGIPIDNQFFEGTALVMLREQPNQPPHQYSHMFEGKSRMFEVQVQGRFRRLPEGELYIGIEIGDCMKLGLVTMGLCRAMLSFAQRLNRNMHYSFGSKDNSELPHISFPLVTNVDTLLVTPQGEAPPPLGQRFVEDPVLKKERMSGKAGPASFSLDCTYTFSFHSMYLSLPAWSTCKIPMVRDMDLHAFWGASPLRITAYSLSTAAGAAAADGGGGGGGGGDRHVQERINYVVCIEIAHVAAGHAALAAAADGCSDGDEYLEGEGGEEEGGGGSSWCSDSDTGDSSVARTPPHDISTAAAADAAAAHLSAPSVDSAADAFVDDDDYYSADDYDEGGIGDDVTVLARGPSVRRSSAAAAAAATEAPVVGAGGGGGGGGGSGGAALAVVVPAAAEGKGGGLAGCPAVLDLYEKNAKKHRWTMFVVVKGDAVVLRHAKHFSKTLPAAALVAQDPQQPAPNPRVSAQECERRRYDAALRRLSGSGGGSGGGGGGGSGSSGGGGDAEAVAAVMHFSSSADKQFAKHGEGDCADGGGGGGGATPRRRRQRSSSERRAGTAVLEGMVVRALSEHHWSEEWAVVTDAALVFMRHRRQELRIDKMDLIRVAASDEGATAGLSLPGFCTVELHTMGRVHYIMIRGAARVAAWVTALSGLCGAAALAPGAAAAATPSSSASACSTVSLLTTTGELDLDGGSSQGPPPYTAFMQRKSEWRGKNRYILNCRRLHPTTADGAPPEPLEAPPEQFVSDLLRRVMKLQADGVLEGGGSAALVEFLDGTAQLRWLDLSGPGDPSERLALFLNLYHVLLMHAHLLVGPPGSALKAASYFNSLSYEVAGDVLSLAELEHGVIRAPLSAPRQYLSKFFLPSERYAFALTAPEPRVSFALNCGSDSGVRGIAVYRGADVDRQLDLMSAYFLAATVEVAPARLAVTLPRVLAWFQADFGRTPLDALRAILKYMTGTKYNALVALLAAADTTPITIKHSHFSWRCRTLELVSTEELRALGALP